MSFRTPNPCLVALVLASAWLSAATAAGGPDQDAKAPAPSGSLALPQPLSTGLIVYLKNASGTPVATPVSVTLVQNGQAYRQITTEAGYAWFMEVAPAEYTVKVAASDYRTALTSVGAALNALATNEITIELQPIGEAERAAAVADLGPADLGNGPLTQPDRTAELAELTGVAAAAPSRPVNPRDTEELVVSGAAPLKAEAAPLAPNAQKAIGKALEALRTHKPAEARRYLDTAGRLAPGSPEINYLYGVYCSELKAPNEARSYWLKALDGNPNHLGALLSLGTVLLNQKKPDDALPYITRAIEAEPSSWRAHAALAEAKLLMGSTDEAIEQAERALELGHGQAAPLRLVLAQALARKGDAQQAIAALKTYVAEYPADREAGKQLEELLAAGDRKSTAEVPVRDRGGTILPAATLSMPLASNWLPPDVDEEVPAVEPGAACPLGEVLKNADQRIAELMHDVDRITATESLVHHSVNKWGYSALPEKRKFDYVVSIEELRPGILNVQEYRQGRSGANEFPSGIATTGLPALVLIFHQRYQDDFEMSCEGRAKWNGKPVWQVHFRQRADRPNLVRKYKIGIDGPSYAVALKGRAWIAADSYQIVRLETDLVAPIPEIHLQADHAIIEYAPVHFKDGNVDMWLPQSAEVYFDFRGRRMHRRHSFGDYLLFSVGEKQRISTPNVSAEGALQNGEAKKPSP
jgi:tetratricopeptide (TPR) repeat protein